MGKTILYIAVSLDGYVAGKNDDISWLFRYNDVDYGYNEFMSHIGAMIQGRRAYDVEVQHGWENSHPVPTFVMSMDIPRQLPKRSDVVFTHEDIEVVLRIAKKMSEKDVWIEGGANIVQQFLKRGLIDEIVLSVVPVILGSGIRLFDNIDEHFELSLLDMKRFEKDLVQLTYKVNR